MAFASQPAYVAHDAFATSISSSRKRKDRYEGESSDGNTSYLQESDCSDAQYPNERRKLRLRSLAQGCPDQMAAFHPLGAEDNVRMLASLGLLPSGPQNSMAGSPDSAPSSVNSSPTSHTASLDASYFPSGHYPNVDPYGSTTMSRAQEAAGSMEVDPFPSCHGPHCTGLPQLYVSRELGCALYARCPNCSFAWEVRNEAGAQHTLSFSP